MRSRNLLAVILAVLIGSLTGAVITGIATTAGAAGGDIPRGAVVAFDRSTCPNGWSDYAKADGRVIAGLRPDGTLRGVVGTRLGDREMREHRHFVNLPATATDESGGHSHHALAYNEGAWRSGSGMAIVAWGDGIDTSGSGIYPVAFASKYTGGDIFVDTDSQAPHTHSVDPPRRPSTKAWNGVPYVQLKYCEKD